VLRRGILPLVVFEVLVVVDDVVVVVVEIDGGDWRDGEKSVSHNGWGRWWDVQ